MIYRFTHWVRGWQLNRHNRICDSYVLNIYLIYYIRMMSYTHTVFFAIGTIGNTTVATLSIFTMKWIEHRYVNTYFIHIQVVTCVYARWDYVLRLLWTRFYAWHENESTHIWMMEMMVWRKNANGLIVSQWYVWCGATNYAVFTLILSMF